MIIKQDYMQEDWFALLQQKISQSNRSQVARELDYSLTAISLILNGKYRGRPDKLRAKVLYHYSVVSCPFVGNLIPLYQCTETATGKAPTHNPIKMAQWRACQSCPNCPKRQPETA